MFYPQVEIANDASTKMSISVEFTLFDMMGKMMNSADKDVDIDAGAIMNAGTTQMNPKSLSQHTWSSD